MGTFSLFAPAHFTQCLTSLLPHPVHALHVCSSALLSASDFIKLQPIIPTFVTQMLTITLDSLMQIMQHLHHIVLHLQCNANSFSCVNLLQNSALDAWATPADHKVSELLLLGLSNFITVWLSPLHAFLHLSYFLVKTPLGLPLPSESSV